MAATKYNIGNLNYELSFQKYSEFKILGKMQRSKKNKEIKDINDFKELRKLKGMISKYIIISIE